MSDAQKRILRRRAALITAALTLGTANTATSCACLSVALPDDGGKTDGSTDGPMACLSPPQMDSGPDTNDASDASDAADALDGDG